MREFISLVEAAETGVEDPLSGLKSVIAHKIQALPDTPEVKDALEEIEDLLKHLGAGVKPRTAAETDFDTWSDEDVKQAKTMLARYVVSLNAPSSAKREMLDLWRSSGLIDIGQLLSGTNTAESIVLGYSENPAIRELADDLIKVDSMGRGKGEFMLCVLSPEITASRGGGDIVVKGRGTVEVKTRATNGARFTDRQVRPSPGYEKLATSFRKKYGPYNVEQPQEPKDTAAIHQQLSDKNKSVRNVTKKYFGEPKAPAMFDRSKKLFPDQLNQPEPVDEAKNPSTDGFPSTGLNIEHLATLYTKVPAEEQANYRRDLTNILKKIFPNTQGFVGPIVDKMLNGQLGAAKQLYGQAALFNYMSIKDDYGMLFIDASRSPYTFTFFNDFKSLQKSGLRLHIGTPYIVTFDPNNVYPPTHLTPTTQEQPSI